MTRVLIVDDDPDSLKALHETITLRMADSTIETATSATDALSHLRAKNYDVIVTDIKMPGSDGLSLLAEIQKRWPETPTIMITGHGDHDLTVSSLRGGAFDFIQKPIDRDYFLESLRRAIRIRQSRRQASENHAAVKHRNGELEQTLRERTHDLQEAARIIESPLRWLIGRGQKVQNVVQQIRQVAGTPLTVLVQGETGTGKELVARAIHQLSSRSRKPFVAVDCGAIPETLIESELFGHEKGAFTGADRRKEGRFHLANEGSLFLDEIGNLSLSTQAKLLRVMQEREVHPLGSKQPIQVKARLIGASNVQLQEEAQSGRFRLDLYHRLNEFTIQLPPLRERDDIIDLADEFIAEASMEFGCPAPMISEAAAEVLLRYSWPGNLRELRNVIRRAVVFSSEVIKATDLSFLKASESRATPSHKQLALVGRSLKEVAYAAAADAEREAIRQALQSSGGNKSKAARELRTDYKTLYLKMKQYGIPTTEFRKSEGTEPEP
jgi:DNA-binding NtrC family response regulator